MDFHSARQSAVVSPEREAEKSSMATSESNTAGTDQIVKVNSDSNNVSTETSIDALANPPLETSQPLREDQIQNAIKFLSHPKVRGSPIVYRRSFLERKGLTKEEIDEAFRQVPDPSTSISSDIAVSGKAAQPNSSTGMQSYQSVQALQSVAGPGSAYPVATKAVGLSKIRWYHLLLSAGFILSLGVSAAVFWKKVALHKLKHWIREVVTEGKETAKEDASSINLAVQQVVETATVTAAEVAKTREELLGAKDEENKELREFMKTMDVQVKSISESIKKLERGDDVRSNGSYTNSWRTHQPYLNGSQYDHLGSVRPSYVNPATASQLREYTSPSEMLQYGTRRANATGSPSQFNGNATYYEEAHEFHGQRGHQNSKAPEHSDAGRNGPTEESPALRRWVPPQPPSIVMPEAAAAIRQPKKLPPAAAEAGADKEVAVGESPEASAATEASSSGAITADANEKDGEQSQADDVL